MTALADNLEVDEKEGKLVDHPVVASDIIYRGALVKHNAAGYLAPCAAEAGAVFAGVAYEKIDNSAGSAGDVAARVLKKGMFLMTGTGFAQTDVGQSAYASDDQTISKTQATNEQEVGKIAVFVSSTQVWVRIDNVAV
jgi:hypothetical protein